MGLSNALRLYDNDYRELLKIAGQIQANTGRKMEVRDVVHCLLTNKIAPNESDLIAFAESFWSSPGVSVMNLWEQIFGSCGDIESGAEKL